MGKEGASKFIEDERATGNGEKSSAEGEGAPGDSSQNGGHPLEDGYPSLVSETIEKFGPLPEEETEKLLEWLRLGSQCVRLKFGRRIRPLISFGC